MEATIVERLNELRQWQIEQQARLLKQQQEQREMLTVQQDRMYRALELSVQSIHNNSNVLETSPTNRCVNNDTSSLTEASEVSSMAENLEEFSRSNSTVKCSSLSSNESKESNNYYNESVCKKQLSNSTFMEPTFANAETNDKPRKCSDENDADIYLTPKKKVPVLDFLMEGVAPLGLQKRSENILSIDDIPVPSPKKDFHTLLEERLQSCTTSPKANVVHNLKNNVKRPFLRKGQGLARFRMSNSSDKTQQTMRTRSTSLSSNARIATGGNNTKKNKKTSENTTAKKNTLLPIEGQHLNLKNVPPPKKKGRSKSMSVFPALQKVKNYADLSSSDLETKTQRELEEVRIFELLEEKAENSSFCSTSSTVLAFLQQSTPSKTSRRVGQVTNNVTELKQRVDTNNKTDELLYNQEGENTSKTIQTRNQTMPSQLKPRHFPARITDAYWETLTQIATTKENSNPRNVSVEKNIGNFETCNSSTDRMKYERDDRPHESYNSAEENDADVSLHVRFAEYNEYKTIGLTDTSSVSSESSRSYRDERIWCDSSPIPDSYNVESLSLKDNPEEISHSTGTDEDESEIQGNRLTEYKSDNKLKIQATDEYNKGDSLSGAWTRNPYENVEESETLDSVYIDETSDDDEANSQKMKFDVDTDDTVLNETDKKNNEDKHDASNRVSDDVNCTTDDTIFKSDLLKTRLLELEREIGIFRKENAALSHERQKLHAERGKLYDEFKEKKEEWEKDVKRTEERLNEEKKKLARDKAAYEIRIRDSQEKNQLYKLERQEVQKLKQQVEELREEMKEKESRWAAAHSRQKSQLRILKVENTKLKQEIEQMENARKSNNHRKKVSNYTNTKAINRINKQLDGYTQVVRKDRFSDEEEDKSAKPMTNAVKSDIACTADDVRQNTTNDNGTSTNNSEQDTSHVASKRNLYEHLLKEAITGLLETEDLTKSTISPSKEKKSPTDEPKTDSVGDTVESKTNVIKDVSPQDNSVSSASPGTKCKSSKENVKVVQHANGHVEHWYPNGNVKKIFPEQGLTKMLYYNGDVCETEKNGKVKYFYASTRTWHTTMPDGLEILEFPDGQIERRSKNGCIEVSFPDGSLRILQSDGIEKWVLPDGTIAETFPNGEKILNFPNGQREIHTEAHKRREYPDGTVKLVYPDGTQETRYSNGRVRLKNKNGDLIVDSHL